MRAMPSHARNHWHSSLSVGLRSRYSPQDDNAGALLPSSRMGIMVRLVAAYSRTMVRALMLPCSLSSHGAGSPGQCVEAELHQLQRGACIRVEDVHTGRVHKFGLRLLHQNAPFMLYLVVCRNRNATQSQ